MAYELTIEKSGINPKDVSAISLQTGRALGTLHLVDDPANDGMYGLIGHRSALYLMHSLRSRDGKTYTYTLTKLVAAS